MITNLLILQSYANVGALIQEDLSEASVIFGVKQVPIDLLEADKTFVFFSHTIKAQEANMPMLDAILEKVGIMSLLRIMRKRYIFGNIPQCGTLSHMKEKVSFYSSFVNAF